MGPTFAQAIGLSHRGIGAFIAMTLIGALVFQWPLGWLSDRIDRRIVIVAATFATAAVAAALAMTATNGDLTLLLALSFLLGGFGMPIYSICVAHTNDQLEPGEVVAAASGLILVYGAGSALGPLAASLLMQRLGPGGLFVFVAVVMLVSGGFGVLRSLLVTAPAAAQKQSYAAVPQTGGHPALELLEPDAAPADDAPPVSG